MLLVRLSCSENNRALTKKTPSIIEFVYLASEVRSRIYIPGMKQLNRAHGLTKLPRRIYFPGRFERTFRN